MLWAPAHSPLLPVPRLPTAGGQPPEGAEPPTRGHAETVTNVVGPSTNGASQSDVHVHRAAGCVDHDGGRVGGAASWSVRDGRLASSARCESGAEAGRGHLEHRGTTALDSDGRHGGSLGART